MHALRVLEFDAIRRRLQDHCETPIGAALALELRPTFDESEVWELLERTRECMDFIAHVSAPSLGSLRDPREPLNRANKGGTLAGSDIFQIADSLSAMRALKEAVKPRRIECPKLWQSVEFLPEHKRLDGKRAGTGKN